MFCEMPLQSFMLGIFGRVGVFNGPKAMMRNLAVYLLLLASKRSQNLLSSQQLADLLSVLRLGVKVKDIISPRRVSLVYFR